MDIPSSVASSQLAIRTNLAQNAVKDNAEQQQKFAKNLEETVEAGAQAASSSNGRGGLVDILA